MELKPMYPAANSRYAQLAQDITEDQEVIPVSDTALFPPAPNYAAVETWDDQEVVLYRGIDAENGLLLDCLRGRSDTVPKPWLAGADVLHVIASDNLNAVMDNVTALADQEGVLEKLREQVEALEEQVGGLPTKTDLDAVKESAGDAKSAAEAAQATANSANGTAGAALKRAGDTATGALIAHNNTSTTPQVRNMHWGTADPPALPAGVIYFKVES